MPRSSEDLAMPKKIGRYEVTRLLGAGAMGRVLLARDPVLDREVAVKVLRGDLQIPADVRDGLVVRMRHEARAAARVSHPNLVTLHDMGEDDEVGLYLVFEYVEGPTLRQRLVEGPLPPKQAARLGRELGAALSFAHDAGILHRDVKPDNVMLSATGGKMADFGIARLPDSTLTHSGGVFGTPAYSAPETFRAGKFSAESDQFSLAASLYESVFGERAFPGDDAVSVAAKIGNDDPKRMAESLGLSPTIDDVFARGLARDPARRFPSCAVFGAALAEALLDESPRSYAKAPGHDRTIHQGPSPAPALGELPRERRLGQVVLGASVVVVTAALLLRTALRSAEGVETSPGLAALDAGAPLSTPSAKTRAVPPSRPRPRANADVDPSRDLDAGAVPARDRSDPDAGAPAAADASKKLDGGP